MAQLYSLGDIVSTRITHANKPEIAGNRLAITTKWPLKSKHTNVHITTSTLYLHALFPKRGDGVKSATVAHELFIVLSVRTVYFGS